MMLVSQNKLAEHVTGQIADLAGFQMVFKLVGLLSLVAFIMTLFIKEKPYLSKRELVENN